MTGSFALSTEVTLAVCPALVQAAEMLTLPAAELDRRIHTEATRNPALIVRERSQCHRCWRPIADGGCRSCPGAATTADRLAPAAAPSGWEQLRLDALAEAPRRLRRDVLAVLTTLDEHGLLDATTRQTLEKAGYAVDAAIDVLRSVGPPGIAACTARDGLLLQVDRSALAPADKAMARRMLTEHAGRLAAGKLPQIAAAEGRPVPEIEALLHRMRRLLTPYPNLGNAAAGHPAPVPPAPDLIFEVRTGELLVRVPERERLLVEVDRRYLSAPAARLPADACQQLRDARNLVTLLHGRWSVIERLGSTLARRHCAQLLAGSTAFGRLTQSEAAVELGVHESTVSRAVRHRTARLPDGTVVPLRRMFGASHDVRAAVAELVAAVPRPSDSTVVELLARRGYRIARRTVSKYRRSLG